MIEYYNAETIKYCYYTALVASPRDYYHQSTFFKLMYVVKGSIKVTILSRKNDKITKLFTAGTAMIITPNDVHRYHVSSRSNDYCHRDIYIFDPLMKNICDSLSPDLYNEIASGEYPLIYSISQNTIYSLEEMLTPLNRIPLSVELNPLHKAIVYYYLGTYLHYKFFTLPYPQWLSKLISFLQNEEFLVKPLEEIILSTNYSHGYVSREFKKYTGKTLKQYVNESKIAFSTTLLTDKNATLENIANRLNLSTTSNYIALFKKQYHITPAQWRINFFTNIDTYPNQLWGNYTTSQIK